MRNQPITAHRRHRPHIQMWNLPESPSSADHQINRWVSERRYTTTVSTVIQSQWVDGTIKQCFIFLYICHSMTIFILFPGSHQPALAFKNTARVRWNIKHYHMHYITSQNAICKEALSVTLRDNSYKKKKKKGAEIAANQA